MRAHAGRRRLPPSRASASRAARPCRPQTPTSRPQLAAQRRGDRNHRRAPGVDRFDDFGVVNALQVWIGAVSSAPLLLNGCASQAGATRRRADACSSSGARDVRRAVPTPASCAEARVRVSRLTRLRGAFQWAGLAAPHRPLILGGSSPAACVGDRVRPGRLRAARHGVLTPNRGSSPRVPGPLRRRIRRVSVRRRAGSRG